MTIYFMLLLTKCELRPGRRKLDNNTVILNFFLLLLLGVYGLVAYNCSQMQENIECLNEPVQYQCRVTGSNILRWRITDENMTLIGTGTYSTGDHVPSPLNPLPNAPAFSTDLSSTSPSLISTISFTVQSSINEYTIHCVDKWGDTKNCTINIAGIILYCDNNYQNVR